MSAFGLRRVWPPVGRGLTDGKIVDIIAIHGLDTHSPRTWEAYEEPKNTKSRRVHWLKDEDMLPKSIPNARIYTYDWNANTHAEASVDNLRGHANVLLDRLSRERKQTNTTDVNPIIFCASCFGGLLLVKALTIASRQINEYAEILRSTTGVVFLGTPFRGSEAASVAKIRVQVAKWAGSETNKTLLNNLSGDSEALDEAVQEFAHLLKNSQKDVLVKFYHETRNTKMGKAIPVVSKLPLIPRMLEKIIVPEKSARLDGYDSIGLDVNHPMLNKYRSKDDQCFHTVAFALVDMAHAAHDVLRKKQNHRNEYWIVPRNPHTRFVGRSEELQTLEVFLGTARLCTEQAIVVISGIGGIGKSELALQVAARTREIFWGIFWVDVGSQLAADTDYQTIANALVCENGRQALSNRRERWLLVLDNADDPDTDYSRLLPMGGTILMTTRNDRLAQRYCGDRPRCYHLDLKELSENAALDLFFSISGLQRDRTTTKLARALVLVSLGRHTLAIFQAGAYIGNGNGSLEEYVQTFDRSHDDSVMRERRMQALQYFDVQEQSRYRCAYETFEISIARLTSSRSEYALQLLGILSMLHYSTLSTELFMEAWGGRDSIMRRDSDGAVHGLCYGALCELTAWHRSLLPDLINVNASRWDGANLDSAIDNLSSLALVMCSSLPNRNGGPRIKTISMHPLLHLWARVRLSQPDSHRTWLTSATLVAFGYPALGGIETTYHPFKVQMSLHVESLLQDTLVSVWEYGTREQITPILAGLAVALNFLKSPKLLEDVVNSILSHFDTTATTAPLQLKKIISLAASVKFWQNKPLDAAKILTSLSDQIMESENITLGDVEDVWIRLSKLYNSIGQHDDAIRVLEGLISISDNLRSVEPLLRYGVQAQLGEIYMSCKRPVEAAKLMENLIAILEVALPPHHGLLIQVQDKLGRAYCQMGRPQEAVKVFKSTIEATKCIQSLEKNSTVLSLSISLASAYFQQKNFAEGKRHLRDLLSILKTRFVDVDVTRLSLEYDIAEQFLEDGLSSEGVIVLEHIVQVHNDILVAGNPSRLGALRLLGTAYRLDGRYTNAIEILEQSLRETPPNDLQHPGTARARAELARAHFCRGSPELSLIILQQSLDQLLPSSPGYMEKRCQTLAHLGEVALALYKPDLAIKALSEAAELSVRKWPLQPFGEAVIHIRLAQAYIDGRRADLALPILEAMVKEPPQYEQYRWSMTWELARAYKNLEQTPRAQKLFMQLVKEIRASKEMTEEQRQGWEYKFLILPQEIRMLVIGEGHVKTQ